MKKWSRSTVIGPDVGCNVNIQLLFQFSSKAYNDWSTWVIEKIMPGNCIYQVDFWSFTSSNLLLAFIKELRKAKPVQGYFDACLDLLSGDGAFANSKGLVSSNCSKHELWIYILAEAHTTSLRRLGKLISILSLIFIIQKLSGNSLSFLLGYWTDEVKLWM